MITMEPVLKRGYAAWDADVLPRDEFAARVDAVRAALRAERLQALVVINHSLLGVMVDYADMAYLSGLQSGGLLLIPVDGEPAFVSFGGGRELAFMRTQTWIGDVISGGRDAFNVLAEELRKRGASGPIGPIGTVGLPALAPGPRARLEAALTGYALAPFDAQLGALRAAKRPRELLAVRIALGIVEGGVRAGVDAFEAGAANASALVAAERAARLGKARDVRVLASMGGEDLRPFEGRLDGRHAPLRLWVGAQYQGYWAEAAATAGLPAPATNAAEQAVRAMQAAAVPGAAAGDIAAAALAALPPVARASALAYGLGGGIGLALHEGVSIAPDRTERVAAGALLALRCVVNGPEPAVASRVVSVAQGVAPGGGLRIEPLRPS